MRKKIVAANWKMNMTQGEATRFVSTFLVEIGESRDVEIVLVPPFTAIAAVNTALDLYNEPQQWDRMVRNGMSRDFSWQRQGGLYVELYEKLLTAA